MKRFESIVNGLIGAVFAVLCRLDLAELDKIPMQGPLIVYGNHINFMDVAVIRPRLSPRPIIGLAKVESYANPLLNILFKIWGGIPIERGAVDRTALNACLQALAQGKLLAVSPEGTRSGDGKLQPAKSGIVLLAVRSGVPLLPVVYWGAEDFWDNLKHLRRTPFHVCVGQPFVVDTRGESLTREVRQRITDEIMFKVAELLPEPYRGVYAHPEREVYRYLRQV